MSHALQGHPRELSPNEVFWENMIHWRRKWQTTPVFLSEKFHGQYEKAKRYGPGKWAPWSEGVQYATGEEWKTTTNTSRQDEVAGSKWKRRSVVDVSGGESKVRCWNEQYCIETWNVRYLNQGKLDVVKLEMTKVKINILGISELKWLGMGEFNSDDHYIYYCGQESCPWWLRW